MNRVKKSLGLLLPSMRISISLALITACMLLSADMLGYTLDEDGQALENRKQIAESLAIQFSVMAPEKDIEKIEGLIRLIVERNPAILSAGITHASGQPIFQSPNHPRLWQGYGNEDSTSSHILVPLLDRDRLWGNVELRFENLKGNSLSGFFQKEIFKLIVFCVLIGFFAFLVFMLRTLRQLDPSAVIPDRVNAAFDALAEGVMILDEDEHILLTNKAFSERIGQDVVVLLGKKASKMKWKRVSREKSGTDLPWTEVLKTGMPIAGAQFDLTSQSGENIKYAINASPIMGSDGKAQGVLVTLDDITQVEEQNVQLKTMVHRLEKTQEQVQEQNKELTYLATRDGLTGCLNRRAFTDSFQLLFDTSLGDESELSCIMVDLDHFKLVNDNFGHAVGDEVIIMLAEVLKANTRKVDLVGRYGGEEFCIVLPGMSVDQAFGVAERIRLRIKDESNKRYEDGPRVTASIGVASMRDNPDNPGALNIFADEALYCAKENGRNRVVSYPTITDIESLSDEVGLLAELQPATVEPKIENLQNRITELEGIATQFSSELEYNKSYDELTGLPNQALFYDRISQGIERGCRHDVLSAVLMLDIEMFSQINASLGRDGGDALLKEIAERLNSIVRKSDGVSRMSVSRVAGDEFAVLFNDIPKKEQVTWAVKRLLDVINQPVDIDGNTIYLKCHVGISLYPNDADNVEELLNNAMSAKQFSKKHRNEYGYQFFDQRVQELSVKHLHLESDLHRAIENEEWTLLYQPKLDLAQREVIGVEALIRWNHPERGVISPIEFIEFAEQRGLIVEIGDWVIKEACRQLRSWMDEGIHDCKIAINVSSVQLIQSDIVHNILKYLEEYKVPPRLFEIEITETILMENVHMAIDSLERLHARGISIAIDDFGTGYSSLSYLKTLPIDSLKIDRGFVRDICTDDNDQKIVQTLISMAHSMDMKVVAEGVETRAQFDLLSKYKVDDVQGNLLSKPVTADEIEALMQSSITLILASENVVQLPIGVKARAN
ncbi:MAG: diguanylate cyclase (GGDEF)-like protein/PAS domain S-box-containing protein [Woeseiaceae bacterium]|jgi:diguanylate cyclase (GGDEF)-like protein/PAS domain S-box-containing protein